MFEGVRYSEALDKAEQHSFPNYYPYRFQPGEDNPTGKATATIPYLFVAEDGTLVRVKGNGASSWVVSGDREAGYRVGQSGLDSMPIGFEPEAARRLDAPFSGPAFIALELSPGVLRNARGRVTYAKAFGLQA